MKLNFFIIYFTLSLSICLTVGVVNSFVVARLIPPFEKKGAIKL